MLSVNHKTILEVSGLSFEDHHLVCHQTIEEVLYLEEACDITIKSAWLRAEAEKWRSRTGGGEAAARRLKELTEAYDEAQRNLR